MKKIVVLLAFIILFLLLRGRAGEGDFSKMNALLVSRLSENPRAAEVFGLDTYAAVET